MHLYTRSNQVVAGKVYQESLKDQSLSMHSRRGRKIFIGIIKFFWASMGSPKTRSQQRGPLKIILRFSKIYHMNETVIFVVCNTIQLYVAYNLYLTVTFFVISVYLQLNVDNYRWIT